jgi:hypothetical protein
MIEYIANFYGAEKRPSICKVFTSSSGESVHTALSYGNDEEREKMSAELIYEHMDNVLKYIAQRLETMEVIPLETFEITEHWPVLGWDETEWGKNEIVAWWNYIYYKDYNERAEHYLAHLHHETEHAAIVSNYITNKMYSEARAAYEELSEETKAMVSNYQELLDAEADSNQGPE